MASKKEASITQKYDDIYEIMTGKKRDPEMPELTGSILFERMQARALVIDNGSIISRNNHGCVDGANVYSFRIFVIPNGEPYGSVDQLIYQGIDIIIETSRYHELLGGHDLIGMYAPTGTYPDGNYPMLMFDKRVTKYADDYIEAIRDSIGDKVPVINRIFMYHDHDKNIQGIPKIHTIYDRSRMVDIIPDAENTSTNMVLMDNYYAVPDLWVQFGCSYITPYINECIKQIYLKVCPEGNLRKYNDIRNTHMIIGALNLTLKYCEFREFSNHFFKGTKQSEMFGFPFTEASFHSDGKEEIENG